MWNPQENKKQGRSCNSWKRDLEADMKRSEMNWSEQKRIAQDIVKWRQHVGSICPRRGKRQ